MVEPVNDDGWPEAYLVDTFGPCDEVLVGLRTAEDEDEEAEAPLKEFTSERPRLACMTSWLTVCRLIQGWRRAGSGLILQRKKTVLLLVSSTM